MRSCQSRSCPHEPENETCSAKATSADAWHWHWHWRYALPATSWIGSRIWQCNNHQREISEMALESIVRRVAELEAQRAIFNARLGNYEHANCACHKVLLDTPRPAAVENCQRSRDHKTPWRLAAPATTWPRHALRRQGSLAELLGTAVYIRQSIKTKRHHSNQEANLCSSSVSASYWLRFF